MKCERCGAQLTAESRYCNVCGSAQGSGGPLDPTTGFPVIERDEIEITPPSASLRSGEVVLIIKKGPDAGARFQVAKDVTTAGRHPESDIFLDDITVSRRHAEIRLTDRGYEIVDIGSLNGTYVNKERIDRSSLKNGDEVQIGKFRMLFFQGGAKG